MTTIYAAQNGPIYIPGPVTVDDVVYSDELIALCRCGMSDNKPFCDDSHLENGFQAEEAEVELLDDDAL